MSKVKRVLLVSPRGFCAGVARAVKAVEDTLHFFGAPVYVKHGIVHNKYVVSDIESKGAITVEELSEVPDGAVVVFSAHGSPPEHYREAKRRHLRLIDATCPLVTKVHLEVQRFLGDGYTVIYIGHRGHIEGIGVLGEAALSGKPETGRITLVETLEDVRNLPIENSEKLAYLTQTTLSIDDTRTIIEALKEKYPQIVAPPLADICYATTNRQEAVRELTKVSDLILIFGSKNSSNSTRLMETARAGGARAHLLDDISELNPEWLGGVETVGMSAGASAPEKVVQEAVHYFEEHGATIEDFTVKQEQMKFSEPLELMQIRRNKIQ